MKVLWKIFKLIRPHKWWMLLAALTGFLTVGSGIGLLMLSAWLISAAALHPSIAELQVAIVGVRFFGISRGIWRYLERLVSHNTTLKLLTTLRVGFYHVLEPLTPPQLRKYKSGQLHHRLINEVQLLEHFFVRALAPPLVAILISILMWLLLGRFNWALALVLIFYQLIAGLALPMIIFLYARSLGTRLADMRSELHTSLLDYVQGLAQLLVFNQAERYQQQLDALSERIRRDERREAGLHAAGEALSGLLMYGAVLTLLILAQPLIHNGILDGVYLAAILLGSMASFEALLPLPEAALHLEQQLRAAGHLFEEPEKKTETSGGQTITHKKSGLHLENVSFTYETEDILRQLNLYFPAGSKSAIVGPSGAGKSTLVQVIAGTLQPSSGKVLIGLEHFEPSGQETITRQVSVADQQAFLFNASLAENLHLADPTASSERLMKVLEQVDLAAHVENLPQGLETAVGSQGQQLSGGQARRVALARALLKDAPVLLLDEALAGVDTATANSILQMLLKDYKNRTLIYVSHQLTGLEAFDRIYVISEGRVVEQGSYADLLQVDGHFARMVRIQNDILSQS